MTTADVGAQNGQNCFLCALDPHPCAETQLEGRIVAAREHKLNRETVGYITLDSGTSFVSLALTRHYRSLIKGLIALGSNINSFHLTLRVYHLPSTPDISTYKDRPWHRYRTNSYTLAVLEPDTLLNITDLNHAEYCPRQYLLHRLASSPTSAAAIRGNLVHACFRELLKEHDRGELMTGYATDGQEIPLATLQRHLEDTLARSSLELALAHVSIETIRAEVAPHLESLATWYQHQSASLWEMPTNSVESERNENLVRAETFLLAPEIGLKGRLDLLWQQAGRQRLLELKTGGGNGDLPKREHRWQVHGYHALLTVRRDSKMKKALATLLYSGTPGEAQAFGIPFTVRELQLVNETRNVLALSHVTGIPPAPPGPSRCTKCAMLDQCTQVSSLLNWQPPQPALPPDTLGSAEGEASLPGSGVSPDMAFSSDDRRFFSIYYHLLQREGREGEQQQALLWKTSVAERVERGTAVNNLKLVGQAKPTGQGEWLQTFACVNTSELRESDEVLLSDGNPVAGEVVTGTIISISAEQVTVWSPELIAHPTLIDRYGSDIVHVRTLQNLLRWLQATPRMRALVAGKLQPRFSTASVIAPRADFNAEQSLAVTRALQMQDYLLIHGPPGTGKTSVIAEIVKRLCQQGQRVMLAAFTNQAVDNMLKRLDREGFHDYVRLGHDRSVAEEVQGRLLKTLVMQNPDSEEATPHDTVHDLLRRIPVVASTTATWSSDKYTPAAQNGADDSPLQFDVAIIDEAGQLTVPAILGALRFAKRFILVGDEKQLPPLVLSKAAAEEGLARSLFSDLKQQIEDYKKHHPKAVSACVPLRTQYRMHKQISDFASTTFYHGLLQPDSSVASRVLNIAPSGLFSTTEASPGSRKGPTTPPRRPLPLHFGTYAPISPAIKRALHPGYPLVFLDVHSQHEHGGTKVSNAEARTVREVVAELLLHGIAEADIGIIAPYRAQVANLRRHLFSDDLASNWQALTPHSPMSIDTVDRFQGGERLVIIMSFATRTTPEADSPLRDFLTNPNRLNVALTRAQRKLILVGCAPALAPLPVFQRLLAHCQRLNTLVPHIPQVSTPLPEGDIYVT